MRITGRVSGRDAIKATLAAMPEVARQAFGAAIQTTASEVARVARAKVRVDTGTLRDHIAYSFSPTYARARVGIAAGTVVVRDSDRREFKTMTRRDSAVFRGQGYKVYRASHYAHLVEYGGRGGRMPASPFLGPAFAAEQAPLDSRMRAAQSKTLLDLSAVGARYL